VYQFLGTAPVGIVTDRAGRRDGPHDPVELRLHPARLAPGPRRDVDDLDPYNVIAVGITANGDAWCRSRRRSRSSSNPAGIAE
jgi:hypothetical protein